MTDHTHTLIAIITAQTVDATAARALAALVERLRPEAACLLLWDDELARYIVGDTWISAESHHRPANFRRRALRLSQNAYADDLDRARCIEPGVLYHPLNESERHTGAVIALGVHRLPDDAMYHQLIRVTTRAIYTISRLEEADREHNQLDAERERLEQLLQAVEQQQRTIDHLLAAEREFSAALEAQVEDRTAALKEAQQRLLQSEKLAVIGQLASSLAHELNNPMQAIQSGLGLMRMELDMGNFDLVRGDLTIIQEELERINTIFHQMLDFYRPVSYESVPLDLNAICEGVRVLMRKRLQEGRVTLDLDLTPHLPLTCGDSNQIKQVLINLLLNAAEAMPKSGGQIILRTNHTARMSSIAVIDDGTGIPPEHRARLFEPLFTTKPRGLGLGLAITQEIIQRHHGHITVESENGTTFTIHLPVRKNCHDDA